MTPALAPGAIPTEGGATVKYVGPFALFMVLLALAPHLPISAQYEAPLRFILLAVACFACWPREISALPRFPVASILIGLAVFAVWIAPEILFHGYRQLPFFSNSIVGKVHSTLPAAALKSPWVLAWRTARAALIVPIVEELFWRGWLMRWLISKDFTRIPVGAFSLSAFFITAVLFASEHGPYWDVGLLAGFAYNLWAIRSRSLADCMLSHGVTNLVLSLYVIGAGQWQYWQ